MDLNRQGEGTVPGSPTRNSGPLTHEMGAKEVEKLTQGVLKPFKARKRVPNQVRVEQYHRSRAALVAQLGGRCERCGVTETLEFDHIAGDRDWIAAKTSRWSRLARYRREAAQGRIQLLCRVCNALKGRLDATRRHTHSNDDADF